MSDHSFVATNWKPLRKGALLGFVDVSMPSGITFREVSVLETNGRYWASAPSKPMLDRRPESALNAAIAAAGSGIFGVLLDAVARGLRRLPGTRLSRLPRMADFALWAVACGDGFLWPEGGFMSAFDANRAGAVEVAIENDPVATTIRALMDAERVEGRLVWTGNSQALLGRLALLAGEGATRARGWPASPRALSGAVTRAATFLRASGIEVAHRTRGDRKFFFTDKRGIFAPEPPEPPGMAENGHFSDGGSAPPTAPLAPATARLAPATARPPESSPAANPQKSAIPGGRGGSGAKIPDLSGSENAHMPNGWRGSL